MKAICCHCHCHCHYHACTLKRESVCRDKCPSQNSPCSCTIYLDSHFPLQNINWTNIFTSTDFVTEYQLDSNIYRCFQCVPRRVGSPTSAGHHFANPWKGRGPRRGVFVFCNLILLHVFCAFNFCLFFFIIIFIEHETGVLWALILLQCKIYMLINCQVMVVQVLWNTAVVIDHTGRIMGKTRKNHIPRLLLLSLLFLLFFIFSRVLRDSTWRYVGRSVGRSVGGQFAFLAFLAALLPLPSSTRLNLPCIRPC